MPISAKFSDAEQYKILDEMNRILADPKFSSSKRCAKLFRRLIEGALDGDQDGIKERMLGIEVFGRDANYDTNADPVVRMAASEIRKRLAHFYQESHEEHPVTVRLIPGSYIPEFNFHNETTKNVTLGDSATAPLPEINTPPLHTGESLIAEVPVISRPVWQSWPARMGILLLLLAGLASFAAYRHSQSPKYPAQWSPLLASTDNLMMCFSDDNPLSIADSDQTAASNASEANDVASPFGGSEIGPFHRIVFEEVKALYKVSSVLIKNGKDNSLRFRPCSEFTPRDLHNTSAIIIGGSDNPWSTRMLSNLRYSLGSDRHTGDRWIQDAQNPAKREWKVDGHAGKIESDYAIIARFFDQETGGWVLVLAGLYPYGTESAADLMTDKLLVQTIPKSIQSNTNFEMVLQTHIVDQVPGHPVIVAVHTW